MPLDLYVQTFRKRIAKDPQAREHRTGYFSLPVLALVGGPFGADR
jgi:hypothetical protein